MNVQSGMKGARHCRPAQRILSGTIAALILCAAASSLSADTIYNGSITQKDVKFTNYANGRITYTTPSGPRDKPVDDKIHINITDEQALNDAEDGWAANPVKPPAKPDAAKWADITDNYLKAMKATNKPWLKDYIAARLQFAAQNANRFDAAVEAWLTSVRKDPVEAGKHKPAVPDATSSYVASTVATLESAEKSESKPAVLQAIWSYELDLYRLQKNDAGLERVANAMASSTGSLTDPAFVAVQADAKLAAAGAAVDKKDFNGALTKLDSGKALFLTPKQQATAAFLAAEAHYGIAKANPPANADAWRDLALEYMRVVANFPGTPYTPDALLRTAELHEKFNDVATAQQTYQAIIRDFPPDSPAAVEARKSVERLKSTPQTSNAK